MANFHKDCHTLCVCSTIKMYYALYSSLHVHFLYHWSCVCLHVMFLVLMLQYAVKIK